jgi:hypothetical protein
MSIGVRGKLLFSFLLVAIVGIVQGVVGVTGLRDSATSLDRVGKDENTLMFSLLRCENLTLEQRRWIQDFFLNVDSPDKLNGKEQNFYKFVKLFDEEIEKLIVSVKNDSEIKDDYQKAQKTEPGVVAPDFGETPQNTQETGNK